MPRDRRQRALPRRRPGPAWTATSDLRTSCAPATGDGDFVWVGLHEPTEVELEDVADRVRPAPARRRGRRQRPPAAQARALRRHALPHRSRRSGTSTRRTPSRPARSTSSSAHDFVVTVRHGEGAELHDARRCLESRRERARPRPVRGGLRRLRPRRRRLRGGRGVAARSTSTRSRRRSSPPQRTNDSARIYMLKRELAEVRRAVLPAARADATVRRRHGAGHRRARRRRSSATSPTTWSGSSESIDSLDPLLSTAFDAHLARISVQQNEDMRKISAGVGAGRRADPDRRRLRHELRPHARAALGAAATRWRSALMVGQLGGCSGASSSAPAGSDGPASGRRDARRCASSTSSQPRRARTR